MDYRSHFYSSYTTSQSRLTSEKAKRDAIESHANSVQRDIVPLLPANRNAKILDLGCGYGVFVKLLQDLGYHGAGGVDLSQEQIDLAVDLGTRNVIVGDLLTTLLDTSQSYDIITMIDVVEHLNRNEAIQVLQGCWERLNNNGLLILRTPNIDARHGAVLSFGDLTHELHLNKLSCMELFATLKFRSVDIQPSKYYSSKGLNKAIRLLCTPFAKLFYRLELIVSGVSAAHLISTPNMIIVARKTEVP